MRIAFVYDVVYPFVIGGIQRRNYCLGKRLSKAHEVSFYGFRSWEDGSAGCLPGCRYVSVGEPVPLYLASGGRRFREALAFGLRLFRPLSRSEEEVWDVANFPFLSIPVAWLLSHVRRRALVVTWHEYWGGYWNERMGRFGFLGRALERSCLAMSRTIVTVSEHMKRRIVAAGVPASRVHVVPNGVDTERIRRAASSELRSDLIWVGRLIPHKQPDLALRAFALLHREQPALILVLVGDGPERERLATLAEELEIGGSARFLGSLNDADEVYGLMKASRVLLLPSRKEGFGITVVEGFCCGIPAVVCRHELSALPELIDEPLKGRVAEPSPESVAAACRELLATPDVEGRRVLPERAARYDWDVVTRELEKVYRKALEAV